MIKSATEIQEILYFGSDSEIQSLINGLGNDCFEYEYSDESDSFSLTTMNEIIRSHGLGFEPNCVHVLGTKFKTEKAVA